VGTRAAIWCEGLVHVIAIGLLELQLFVYLFSSLFLFDMLYL